MKKINNNFYPFITIITPAYNEEHNIQEHITYLMENLDYPKNKYIIIIIVDDGSKDKTFEKACELKEKYKNRLIVIKNPKNLGIGPALNLGLKYSKGDYVAYLSADDKPSKKWLKSVFKFLSLPEEYIAINFLSIKNFYLDIKFNKKITRDINLSELNSGFIIKKQKLIEIGGWPNRRFGEDSVLTRKLLRKGFKILHVNDIIIHGKPRPQGFLGHLKRNLRYAYLTGLDIILSKKTENGLLKTFLFNCIIYPILIILFLIGFIYNDILMLIGLIFLLNYNFNLKTVFKYIKAYKKPKNKFLKFIIFLGISFCESIIYMIGIWRGVLKGIILKIKK